LAPQQSIDFFVQCVKGAGSRARLEDDFVIVLPRRKRSRSSRDFSIMMMGACMRERHERIRFSQNEGYGRTRGFTNKGVQKIQRKRIDAAEGMIIASCRQTMLSDRTPFSESEPLSHCSAMCFARGVTVAEDFMLVANFRGLPDSSAESSPSEFVLGEPSFDIFPSGTGRDHPNR